MPRIEFDGKGDPIPSLALPPFGSDTDLPTTVLTFTENTDFSVSDYVALGFTHFEAWCVGAAGGRGGDASSQIIWVYEDVQRPVGQDVWNLRLEQIRISDYITSGVWDKVYGWGVPGPNGNFQATMADFRNWENPNHLMSFKTYRQSVLFPQVEGMGGGGGGGGFQKVAGALATLPGSVSIVVGKAGADSPYGQTAQNGVWTPSAAFVPLPPDPRGYPWDRLVDVSNYLGSYTNSWPFPHNSLSPPQSGEDGGASSFGIVGQASGGKGGAPGMVWDGAKFILKGDGGAGGIGGRILSGGGAAGSISEGVNGGDGIWLPETGIGAGGGGGKGGRFPTATGNPQIPGSYIVTQHLATAGGQGSFSYADTSVYGQRQFRQPWTYMKPSAPLGAGTLSYTPVIDSNNLVTPGGGGGARPLSNLKVGSKAPGYSPNGVVVLRLTKIT